MSLSFMFTCVRDKKKQKGKYSKKRGEGNEKTAPPAISVFSGRPSAMSSPERRSPASPAAYEYINTVRSVFLCPLV